MRRSRNAALIRSGLAAAFIAAGALITVPVGPVPFTLQTLGVTVAMLVLPPWEALGAAGTYVALGTMGLPVFSGGGGGAGVLVGPTGGFLAGFVVGCPLGACLRRVLSRSARLAPVADALAACGLLVCVYALGVGWFATSTQSALGHALAVAVAPFVVPDLLKAGVAIAVARVLRSAGYADTACAAGS